MAEINFSVTEVDGSVIIRDYFLDRLFSDSDTERKNVALALKSIYFYRDLLTSHIPADVERIICRDALILIYSVIEAAIVNSAENIQKKCRICRKECPHNPREYGSVLDVSAKNRFQVAYDFLESVSILKFGSAEKEFFDKLRDMRNDVHLLKSSLPMESNTDYNRDACTNAVRLMQGVFRALAANLDEFDAAVCSA